jgi:hypothetical protein
MNTKTLLCVLAVIMLILTGKNLCTLESIKHMIVTGQDVSLVLKEIYFMELIFYSFGMLALALVAPTLRKKC